MTIIEVLFAIVILSGVMLSLSRFGQGFARASRDATYLSEASDLAAARLDAILAHNDYASLGTRFNGTVEPAPNAAYPSMAGYSGYERRTAVAFVTTDTARYARITVTVSSPKLSAPLRKSVIVSERAP